MTGIRATTYTEKVFSLNLTRISLMPGEAEMRLSKDGWTRFRKITINHFWDVRTRGRFQENFFYCIRFHTCWSNSWVLNAAITFHLSKREYTAENPRTVRKWQAFWFIRQAVIRKEHLGDLCVREDMTRFRVYTKRRLNLLLSVPMIQYVPSVMVKDGILWIWPHAIPAAFFQKHAARNLTYFWIAESWLEPVKIKNWVFSMNSCMEKTAGKMCQ